MTPRRGWLTVLAAVLFLSAAWRGVARAGGLCPGDCSGDGTVTISELIACVGAALQPSPACPACDVDGDGAVRINELVAAVNAALTAFPPPSATPSPAAPSTSTATPTASASATPADSPTASPTPPPSATASATGTDTATPSPTGTPSLSATATRTRTPRPPTRTATASPTFRITAVADVVHAAAEVAVQNLETVEVLTQVCASVGACQTGAAPGLAGGTGRPVELGVSQPCAVTGTRMETCRASVLQTVFSGCVEPGAAGTTSERDGTVLLTVADPGFCDDLVIDPLAAVALELRQYRHVERDAQSVEVARLEAEWLETLTPVRPGCQLATDVVQLADGSLEVSGTLHFACGPGSHALSCPRGRTDLTLQTRSLQMFRESGGTPCELRLRMIGTVALDDGDRDIGGRSCRMQFAQTFTDFLFAETPLGDGTTIVRQAGRFTVDQLGPLDLATRPPAATPPALGGVRFVDGTQCPIGGDGVLEVRQPSEGGTGTADAPTVRFQQSATGDPQVVFAVPGSDAETVTGCIGISPLTTCE